MLIKINILILTSKNMTRYANWKKNRNTKTEKVNSIPKWPSTTHSVIITQSTL